jgi:peptide/nickel transport system ATP-binding protein
MSRPLLAVERLAVGLPALPLIEEASFAVRPGATFALVGESGSGKSLTALAIMGLLSDRMRAAGSIRWDGRELIGLPDEELQAIRGDDVAMVFQEPMTALNPVMTIGDQIRETLRLHLRISREEATARVRAMMTRVGLPPERFSPDLYPHQLSGGQRQRVMIAAALVCGPRLLIADEPTTALDVTIQAQILDLLGDLVEERGMALLLITHDLAVVSQMTQEVGVMYAGRLVERGATAQALSRPRHPYTAGLLAASPHAETARAPSPKGVRARLPSIPGRVPDPAHRPTGCAFAPRCPRAQDDCRVERPPMIGGADGHAVACFHPLEAP